MLKFLAIAGVVLAVGIVGVLALAAMKPDVFEIRRSATINAPADRIYPLIVDFRRWPEWSPYENKDPNMKRTYGATSSGAGATYAWDGDKTIGAGSMEITEASVPAKVALKLDFTRPMDAHNTVVFSLAPQGGATVVTWDMRGPTPFIGKIFHVFINMDKMVGSDFEAGLAKLKQIAEARP